MIVYYLQREMFTRRGKIHARVFRGQVEFYERSRSRAIKLGTATVCRPRIIFRATVFDDATTPSTLIRCDIGFHELRERGAELPLTYINSEGRILRSEDDSDVFEPERKTHCSPFNG